MRTRRSEAPATRVPQPEYPGSRRRLRSLRLRCESPLHLSTATTCCRSDVGEVRQRRWHCGLRRSAAGRPALSSARRPASRSPSAPTASPAPGGASVNAIRVGDPFKGGGTPDPTNPGITCPTKVRTVQNWFNPCAFANPEAGQHRLHDWQVLRTARRFRTRSPAQAAYAVRRQQPRSDPRPGL